jgi:membrane protease YdiL (CAAX protease family)
MATQLHQRLEAFSVADLHQPLEALSPAERRRIWRNLLLYTVGVMTLSVVGGVLSATGADIGGLFFISGPILMAILLRALGGDGWQDAGLRLGALPWYLFALLLFPVTVGLILGIGVITGTILFRGSLGALAGAAVSGLAPALIFATFEEWGWRGYLEPRLARLGLPDLRRHLLVGLIWAVWHIPYFLATPGFIALPPALYALLMVGGFLAMAVVYGPLRKASGAVWTAVLAHGLGNALAQPLLLGGMAEFRWPALIATRPENLFFIGLWAIIGWWLIRRKR